MFELSESQIEMQICQYLAAKGYFFWKQPSSGYFDAGRKRFRKHVNPYVGQGVPDIILIHLGEFIGLEVKSKKGVQSSAQKEFQKKIEKAGSKYFIVRSLEDVQAILRQL